MSEKLGMDVLLNSEIGRSDGKWFWRAQGDGVAEFCAGYGVAPDGWLYVGPFETERDAERDLRKFEKEFFRVKHPKMKIRNAPDPRSLN